MAVEAVTRYLVPLFTTISSVVMVADHQVPVEVGNRRVVVDGTPLVLELPAVITMQLYCCDSSIRLGSRDVRNCGSDLIVAKVCLSLRAHFREWHVLFLKCSRFSGLYRS